MGRQYFVCRLWSTAIIKTYRSKSAKDLSVIFLWFWLLGELLTFLYIVVGDYNTGIAHFPLYFNYMVNIFMACYLIYAKHVYPKKLGENVLN